QTTELSVIIPVYNSADIFPELYQRLKVVLDELVTRSEIVAVVDGCADRSFDVISNFSVRDPRVKVIDLSRNFGHQAAVSAGLTYASGNLVAIMDDDLEDPPEQLKALKTKLDEGYDVVYGIRKNRRRSYIHRLLFAAFYRVFGWLADIRIPNDVGDFCLMRRVVVDALNRLPESNRYLRGLRAWVGFRQTGIPYDRASRFANKSGYSFRKYFALASDAIFAFSYKPLRIMSSFGLILAVVSLVWGAKMILTRFINPSAPSVPGWLSLWVSIFFFSGVQLLCMGILGQYLLRIYDEVKQRPEFIVRRSVGFDEPK
ncbi:MAG: glycosyltransferase family 2 protein, partial [Kiritimatiellia bacterium]|nr:glycosyltransferase family 2 protein [Kiritimatiellia bacterium]